MAEMPAVAASSSHDRVILFCPECSRRFSAPGSVLSEPALKILCGSCDALFSPSQPNRRVPPEPAYVPALRPTVVVAHESPAVCATVGRVLEEAGFAPRYVHDGARAIAAFDASMPDRPVALVVDVGIPEVLAFQVCAILKGRQGAHDIRVVLLASVFERTRYKRRPTSLHGADAYVELHHVPDRLGPLLQDLMAERNSPDPGGHMPVERARAETLRPAAAAVSGAEAMRALARRVVSDMALYHEAGLARGLRAGDAFGEPEVAAALAEARALFDKQAEQDVSERMDIFEEAVRELLAGLVRAPHP